MAKRSKSRFTELVKFSPDEEQEKIESTMKSEIMTDTISTPETSDSEDEFEISTSNIVDDDDFNFDTDVTKDSMYIEDEDTIDMEDVIGDDFNETITSEDFDDFDDYKNEGVERNMKRADIAYLSEEETVISNKTKTSTPAMRTNINTSKELTESIILGNTTIKGDIITDTGIQIYGAVIGNVESGGRVQLVGKVEGDISGQSVVITDTSLNGNINAEEEVLVKKGCQVNGDITAGKIVLNGEVNGNIDAEGQVDFEAGSVLEGNVSAKSFNIKPGARINGSIGTK